MIRKERYFKVIEWFKKNRPEAETELEYNNPFQLLVAVILSAQCTDKRVNIVTPPLFRDFPTPEDLSQTTFEELFPYIRSISYPNNKTKHLIGMAKKLVDNFDSKVPENINDLLSLPGVGRKTANVIASVVYDKPVIAVDTHVFRVSHRLGLSDGKTPEAVEKDLEANIPEEYRAIAHHWLILHGRYICTARKPKCEKCELQNWCRYYIEENLIITS